MCNNKVNNANNTTYSEADNYKKEADIATIDALFSESEKMMVKCPIIALGYIDSAWYIAQELNNDSCIALANYLYGKLNEKQANYLEAATYYFNALKNKQYFNDTIIGDIYYNLGECYHQTSNIELYEKYLTKAHHIYDSLNYPQGLGKISHSKGNYLYECKKHDESLKFYLQTLEYYKKSNYIKGIALMYNNLGNIYEHLNLYELALDYYEKGIESANELNDHYIISLIEMNTGNMLVNKGDKSGFDYLERVKLFSIKYGFKYLVLNTTSMLGNNYAKIGEYEKALENINLNISYHKETFDEEKRRKLAQLDYKHEVGNKRKVQEIQAFKREKRIKTQNIIAISSFLIVSLIALLYYLNFKNKTKINSAMHEILLAQLKQEEIKRIRSGEELKLKNLELEKLALHIIQKKDFIQNIKDKINELRTGMKKTDNLSDLSEIENYINQSMSLSKDRKTLDLYLDKYNQDFIHKLEKNYPDLTEMEKRLIVLLRLNFSTKEIATLFDISSKSIEMYRYNLRKKINLDPNQKFTEFLATI